MPDENRHYDAAIIDLLLERRQRPGELSTVRASGNSMLPFIRSGDEIQVHGCPFDDVRPGDIIVFRGFECLVVHRAVKVTGGGAGRRVYEKGDNTPRIGLVTPDSFLGHAVEIRTPRGRLVLAGVAFRFAGRAIAFHGRASVRVMRVAAALLGPTLGRVSRRAVSRLVALIYACADISTRPVRHVLRRLVIS